MEHGLQKLNDSNLAKFQLDSCPYKSHFFCSLVIARSNQKWTECKVLSGAIRQPNLQSVRLLRQCVACSVFLVKSFYSNNNKHAKWFK